MILETMALIMALTATVLRSERTAVVFVWLCGIFISVKLLVLQSAMVAIFFAILVSGVSLSFLFSVLSVSPQKEYGYFSGRQKYKTGAGVLVGIGFTAVLLYLAHVRGVRVIEESREEQQLALLLADENVFTLALVLILTLLSVIGLSIMTRKKVGSGD